MSKPSLPNLLLAIAAVESNGGLNNYPRVEPAYIPKGFTFTIQGKLVSGTGTCVNDVVRPRWRKWGLCSACSYSSWQILYHTAADMGFEGDPRDLWKDIVARPYVYAKINKVIEPMPVDVDELEAVRLVGRIWNGGNAQAIVPSSYLTKLCDAYTALCAGT
jgi:hypothetical protein